VDSRLSIEERYPDRDAYLTRIEAAARELVGRRLLLESEIQNQIRLAGERWDWVMGGLHR
jgi:hypothetical protein